MPKWKLQSLQLRKGIGAVASAQTVSYGGGGASA